MSRDIPSVLSPDEQYALLEAVSGDRPNHRKNRAMISIMLGAGLRVSEVSALQRTDLDFPRCKIRNAKGGKDRVVYLPDWTVEAIEKWLSIAAPSQYVYPTRKGTQTSTRSIRRSVKTYAEKAGISWWKNVSPHTLRHTFATEYLQQTGDLYRLKKALGHSDISTTEIYLHVRDEQLEESMTGLRDPSM